MSPSDTNEVDLTSPELLINRELSWLEFNERVLQQGRAEEVPVMERLKFLAIVSSNLDEFFMVRVAGLKQQVDAGLTGRDASGLTALEQLNKISERAHHLGRDQSHAIVDALAELAGHGVRLVTPEELTAEQDTRLESYFTSEVLPLVTPLAVDRLDPFPVLPGLALHLALVLKSVSETGDQECLAVIPIPSTLSRFVQVQAENGVQLLPIELGLQRYVNHLFPDYRIEAHATFRLTRDAAATVIEDDSGDLLQSVEEVVRDRRRGAVVRLEVSSEPDGRILEWLTKWAGVSDADIYEVPHLLDATCLMDVTSISGFDHLKDPDWPPLFPQDLAGSESVWETLQEKDVLLFHPYESFEPVTSLLENAADDPAVFAIKQTLYRTSGDSPIVSALERAGENGKQVTVLVELRARFDESRNIKWARRLEDAGCHVIYGIAGLKTHAKLLLIVRREPRGIRRYVHLSTGNYNDRTARLYSDLSLLTTDRDLTSDAAAFFNMLTGYSQDVGWAKLSISPRGIRQRLLELIDREINTSTPDQPGLIMAKLNALQHKSMCQALYRASRAGVKVLLNVRGICCLRPGLKGISDNIRVTSIVDRYLEHARILYFRNGGRAEVYMSSADLMKRNLDDRLETMFPISNPTLRRRIIKILEMYFQDNVKAWELQPDGQYARVKKEGPPLRAQERLYRATVKATRAPRHDTGKLKPLRSPEKLQDDT
jgi:polyphosphate kinase